MPGEFPRDKVNELLKACHRRCCICHRFCGVKIEIDHILPAADGGSDTIENAIAVCLECHAEIHSYNDRHPRGRKFRPEELRGHREQWLDICRSRPEIFVTATRNSDVGPLQALIDELEFNGRVAQHLTSDAQGCLFQNEQFQRAIREGAVATLVEELKSAILEAYVRMGSANQLISAAWIHPRGSNPWAEGVNEAQRRIFEAGPKIEEAKVALLQFLSSE